MENKNMYRILVATIFVLLMSVGVYLGVELADEKNSSDVPFVLESNTDAIQIYNEEADIEEEKELIEVDVKFIDVYPDCGHSIESEEHQENTTKDDVRKEIEEKDLGYKLVGEQDGILLYQKVYVGKCMNHYKVILENDLVNIYRMSANGEFEIYQTTEITSSMLREGIKEQLKVGIEVDDIEELFLLMEDIES